MPSSRCGRRIDADFLNIGQAVQIFLLGFCNIFASPLSEKYGRRPIYLFATVLAAVSQIICAFAPNKGAWLFGRILLGAAGAPFEQLPALSVKDQFFVHERGLGLSIYVAAISAGGYLGSVVGGFVVEDMGWRCKLQGFVVGHDVDLDFQGYTAGMLSFWEA